MQRILFVEDNAVMLQMYGLMLSGESEVWEVSLAADGAQALALMERASFDVIVSDMQMPGMTGAELVRRVRELYPQTSRIIISGVSDQKEVADALGETHQFIAKPFDLKTLKATLSRLNALDRYLQDEKLKTLVGRLGAMPSFPALYLEIMKALDSPSATIESIADVIAKDPSMTAKILQVVNSAAIGLSEKIHSPFEALQHLGLNTVRSLALSAHVFARFEQKPIRGFSAGGLWEHLMKTAALARKIMECEGAETSDVDDAYTAAMLHDMGKLMLADGLPAEFQRAITTSAGENIPLHEAELRIFGNTHAGVAAYLLGLWGLSAPVVEAVALHHLPERSDLLEPTPLTAVHVANALVAEVSAKPASGASKLNLDYLDKIGLTGRLEAWRAIAAEAGAQEEE